VVGKRFQPSRGFEKCARALFGTRGKLGSAQVPHHQRVSAQQEPGFRATGLVSDQQTEVFRRVAGSMEDLDLDIAEVENITIIHPEEPIPGSRTRVQDVIGARQFGKLASGGDVVGMHMGIDDVADLCDVPLRYLQVRTGIVDWVAHGGQTLPASTEYIGGGDRGFVME